MLSPRIAKHLQHRRRFGEAAFGQHDAHMPVTIGDEKETEGQLHERVLSITRACAKVNVCVCQGVLHLVARGAALVSHKHM